MFKKKAFKITAIVIIVLGIIFALLPTYLKNALIYQHAGIEDYTIFANRIVTAGNFEDWKVSKKCNSFKISENQRKVFEEFKSVAFLVIQNDSIKYEEYWDDYSENSLSNSFSMAKSIVGLLIGIAIDEGLIKSIDQKVSDYFPELGGKFAKDLTIRHLLMMSSGLNWDEQYSSAFSKTTQAYYGNDINKLILSLKVVEKPGEKYSYKSCDTQLLSMILQKASGKNISEFASEKLWKPIGAKNNALWSLDHENGMEKTYCCFNSNARDFAHFGKLILNNGKWNEKQLVSENYLQQSLTPLLSMTDEDNQPVDYYGYQWWMMNYKGYEFKFARGLNGQYIFAIPQLNAIVVRLGFARSEEVKNHQTVDTYTYLDVALEILQQ